MNQIEAGKRIALLMLECRHPRKCWDGHYYHCDECLSLWQYEEARR